MRTKSFLFFSLIVFTTVQEVMAAELVASIESESEVRLGWTAATERVRLSYTALTEDAWHTLWLDDLEGAEITSGTEFNAIKAPGSGVVTLPTGAGYKFKLEECSVFPMGSFGSELTLLCGEGQAYYGGVYNGAQVESQELYLSFAADSVHSDIEYTEHSPSLANLATPAIIAQPADHFGKVKLRWATSASWAVIERRYGSDSHWQKAWSPVELNTGDYPAIEPNAGGKSYSPQVAPSGDGFFYTHANGPLQFRLRGCGHYSPDRGATFTVRCESSYSYSELIYPEALGFTNLPPEVSFFEPSTAAEIELGGSVELRVNAQEATEERLINSSNVIEKVEFYISQTPGQVIATAQRIHTALSPQNGHYVYSYVPDVVGDFQIIAVATDTGGATSYTTVPLAVRAPALSTESVPINNHPLKLSQYEVYYGDFDSDGNQDIYFHGARLIVLLHGDIITPITLPSPAGFAYFGYADGSYGAALPWDMTQAAVETCSLCKRATPGRDVVTGELNGDGHPDILIKGRGSNNSTIIISGTDGEALPLVLLEVKPNGHTQKPGQQESETPHFVDNLLSASISISNRALIVSGQSYTLIDLQQQISSVGAAQSKNENTVAPSLPRLPEPTLSAAGQAEIDAISSVGGEFKVNEMGASTYFMPLTLPKGTAGVSPQLAFTYSSQAGTDDMGLGWSLAAGGSISRCRKTLQTDKQVNSISFGPSDRYCLDGQRLIVVDGVYGEHGSLYRRELDDGTEVTLHNTSAGQPDFFAVSGKDGSRSIYGAVGNHTSEVVGHTLAGSPQAHRVMSWKLSQFADSAGNEIIYTYSRSRNFHQLSSLKYGYGRSDRADVVIDFVYRTTKQSQPFWILDSRFNDNSLLTKVVIQDQGEEVRRYDIEYDTGVYGSGSAKDNLDRVTNIKACVGEQCSRPLIVKWGTASPGAADHGNGRVLGYSPSIFNFDNENYQPSGFPKQRIDLGADSYQAPIISGVQLASDDGWQLGVNDADINGDGRTDLLVLSADLSLQRFVISALVQDDNGFKSPRIVVTIPGNITDNSGKDTPEIQITDFNADGRSDFAVYSPSTSKWRTFASMPEQAGSWKLVERAILPEAITNLAVQPDDIRFADMNSDGLVDIAYTLNGSAFVHYLRRRQPTASETEADISASMQAYEFNGVADIVKSAPDFDLHKFGGAFDINEDGRTDLLGTRLIGHDWFVKDDGAALICKYNFSFLMFAASSGLGSLDVPGGETSFYWNGQSGNECRDDEFRRRLIGPYYVDINGDALEDMVWAFAKTNTLNGKYPFDAVLYRLGQPNMAFSDVSETALNFTAFSLEIRDIDSDGKQDLLVTGAEDKKWLLNWNNNGFSDPDVFLEAEAGRHTSYRDFNSDGNLDRYVIKENVLEITYGKPRQNNLVVQFESGMGAITSISYEPLSQSGRYTATEGVISSEQTGTYQGGSSCPPTYPGDCPTATYPIYTIDSSDFYTKINDPFAGAASATDLEAAKHIPAQALTNNMAVVTRVSSSAPSGWNSKGLAGVDYAYEELRIQAGGRGMLGFKRLKTVDLQTGISTETEYRQDWPFIGTPQKTVTQTKDGQKLKESTTGWAIYGVNEGNVVSKRQAIQGGGTAQISPLRIYQQASTDTTYRVGGEFLEMPDGNVTDSSASEYLLSQVTSSSNIDEEGNVDRLEVVTKESSYPTGPLQTVKTQITTNSYYPGDGKRFGRLQESAVSATRQGAATVTRNASFTYFGYPGAPCASGDARYHGLLCSEQLTVENLTNSATPELTQHFYDDHGNKSFTKTGARVSPANVYDNKGRHIASTYDVFRAESGQEGGVPIEGYSAPSGAVAVKTLEVMLRNKFGQALLTRSKAGKDRWVYTKQAATPMGRIYFNADSTGNYQQTSMQRTILSTANWCTVGTEYTTTVDKAGGAQATTCHDKLGRAIGEYHLGFNGEIIRTRTDYDTLGRIVRVSQPAKDAVPSQFTETIYDVLGRPVQVIHPHKVTNSSGYEVGGNTRVTYDYYGLLTHVITPGHTDGPDRIKEERKNALGETVHVQEGIPFQLRGERVVSYLYDSLGNLTGTVDPHRNQSLIVYNDLGQKVAMTDPDKGSWQYHYNSYGDLVRQVDANGSVTINEYDFKGRRVAQSVTAGNGSTDFRKKWTYDTGVNGLGQLARELKESGGGDVEFAKQYTFDNFGRSSVTTTTFAGAAGAKESHHQKVSYDEFGRPFQVFDAARAGPQFTYNGIQNVYNSYGYLARVDDVANGGSRTFYTVSDADARGNVTDIIYGNGDRVTYTYHALTGFLAEIKRVGLLSQTQTYTATWDHLGNLVSRKDDLFGGTVETFKYDAYNRLESNTLGDHTVSLIYDSIDNIKNKSDFESGEVYQYHGTKVHAVAQVGDLHFKYDFNGNVTGQYRNGGTDRVKSFKYTASDLVSEIKTYGANAHSSAFHYGTGNDRYKRVDTDSTGKKTTTLYIGGVEKIHNFDGSVQWKRSIGGYAQITHVVQNGRVDEGTRRFLHKDHLGSVVAITGAVGGIEERMAYDPWGVRRKVHDGAWTGENMVHASVLATYSKTSKPITSRGFTGHEMLDEVGIIHMNGRIYDGRLGRFLQADPIIQEPTMIGSLNRYSYTMNNPLNAVDPSGFSWLSERWDDLRPYVGAIAAIAIVAASGGAASPFVLNFAAATGLGVFSGALGAIANGGNAGEGALLGGVAAAAFFGIGAYYRHLGSTGSCAMGSSTQYYNFGGNYLSSGQIAGQITLHATAGGVMSDIQGGKFGHGFASAGITKSLTNVQIKADGFGNGLGALTAGLTGGTVSFATGGKFANGFKTASFQYIFNAMAKRAAGAIKDKTPLLSRSERMEFIKGIGANGVDIANSIDLAVDLLRSPEGIAILKDMFPEMASMPSPYMEAYIKVMGDSYVDSKSLVGLMGGDVRVEAIKEYALLNLKVYRAFQSDNWLKRAGGLSGAAAGLSHGASTKNFTILQFYGDQWLARDPF